jgi:hypothetical protein
MKGPHKLAAPRCFFLIHHNTVAQKKPAWLYKEILQDKYTVLDLTHLIP